MGGDIIHTWRMLDAGKQPQIKVRLTQKPPIFAFGGAARAISFLVGSRAETDSIFLTFRHYFQNMECKMTSYYAFFYPYLIMFSVLKIDLKIYIANRGMALSFMFCHLPTPAQHLAPAQGKADAAKEICDLCGLEMRHTVLQVGASFSLFWAAQVRICGLGHWL